MELRNSNWRITFLVTTIVFGVIALFALALTMSHAPSVLAGFPPRPGVDVPEEPPPGYIELRIHWTLKQRWTVVQWLDGLGNWHDVEGWRGDLDEIVGAVGKKTWAVTQRDYGTGPFRWVVYDKAEGRPLVYSDNFYLPYSGQTVMADLPLPW